MDSIEGFILAGGQSRRMGTDKSHLVLDGQTLVERIACALAGPASSVTIVGKNAELLTEAGGTPTQHGRQTSELSIRWVPDVYPDWGALGGVHAALSACAAVWALVVGCDFPFVTSELFARLVSLAEDFEAVAPIQSDGIPQPLCALYRVRPCLNRAAQQIKCGERKPIGLLQSVRTRWVSFDELKLLAGADHFFDNLNTPEDYARARERSWR